MKKLLLLFLLILTLLAVCACQRSTGTPPVESTDTEIVSEKLTETESTEETTALPVNTFDISVIVDGNTQPLTVEPVVKEHRLLVAMDDIAACLGVTFSHDAATQTATAATEDYSVKLVVGSTTANGSRRNYTIEVAPEIIDGAVMLPIEFVASQMGYKVEWDEQEKLFFMDKLVLFREQPKTQYHEWALERARQLTDFTFTPVKDIPTYLTSKEKGVFEAGKEYKGFPYSSTESNDKFICENVSFETFLSALANPDSVLYTKNLYSSNNASTYYGMVCNGFVRYCLGIVPRCNTQNWLKIPGMKTVAAKGSYTVNDLELCDILHAYGDGVNHVAFITGILRDSTGKIVQVEVSDQLQPTSRRRLNSVEDFDAWIEKYKLCRYENMESVPPFDEEQNAILFESCIDKITPMIAVDYGNKSNYMYGDTTVISSFAEGKNTVEIYRDDALIETIEVNGYEKISRNLDGGYYIVKLAGTEHFTEFCVCKPDITHTVSGNLITIVASPGDENSEILHMEFRQSGTKTATLNKTIELTEEERALGVFSRTIPSTAYTYKVSFENKYGVWTHKIIQIGK